MAAPTWVITCSVKLPSLAANVFSSRWAPYVVSAKAIPSTRRIASSAASRSPIFSSRGIAKGSSATGVS